jgi:predicted Fe-Mo cluster-binding NifX family protein
MRIAVTAQGRELNSPVDPSFGRARFFVVIDTGSGAFAAAGKLGQSAGADVEGHWA